MLCHVQLCLKKICRWPHKIVTLRKMIRLYAYGNREQNIFLLLQLEPAFLLTTSQLSDWMGLQEKTQILVSENKSSSIQMFIPTHQLVPINMWARFTVCQLVLYSQAVGPVTVKREHSAKWYLGTIWLSYDLGISELCSLFPRLYDSQIVPRYLVAKGSVWLLHRSWSFSLPRSPFWSP